MTTGGTIITSGDKLDSSRDKISIQGQGLIKARAQEVSSLGIALSEQSTMSSSRPSTAVTSECQGEPIGSFSMPPEAVGVLETVINMNKALEEQIDTLRMRLTIEAKNHDTVKQKITLEKEKELAKKEDEIGNLKDALVKKEERIGELIKEGHSKDYIIKEREHEIDDLHDLVKKTEDYADQLQTRINKLKIDKNKLESNSLYKEQNDDIRRLRYEIASMKEKVNTMERELGRARNIIENQNTKIKALEAEKGAISEKFREEVEKASRAMRSEVERMREVMKQQYEEMRNMREQNTEISNDVRDIKDILLKVTINQPVNNEKLHNIETQDTNNYTSPTPIKTLSDFGLPLTARPTKVLKPNATVRTSMPTIGAIKKSVAPVSRGRGLPSIKPQQSSLQWLPPGSGGINKKIDPVTVKSARGNKR